MDRHTQLKIPTHDKGMVSAFPVTILPQEEGYSRTLYNMDFDEVIGVVRKRYGYTSIMPELAAKVKGAHRLLVGSVTPAYVAAYGAVVAHYDDPNWVDISPVGWTTSTATYCSFVTQAERIIASDGENTPFMWDGTTTTELTEMPKARFIAQHRTRVFAAGVDNDPLVLRVCHPGDPAIWDPAATGSRAFTVYTGDNLPMTAILAMDDSVLIGKNYSIYVLVGQTTESFALFPLDRNIGIGSHWAAVLIGGVAYFPDSEGSIYRLEPGATPQRISDAVKDYTDQVNSTRIEESRAFAFRNTHYVITLPVGSDEFITLVYDVLKHRWRVWDLYLGEVMDTHEYLGSLFTLTPQGNQFFYLDSTSLTDNGTNIDAYLDTLELHMGAPHVEKEFNNLWLGVWVTDHVCILDVECRLNQGSWFKLAPRGVTVDSNENNYMRIRIPVGKVGHNIQFRISNNRAQNLRILDMIITFLPKELE